MYISFSFPRDQVQSKAAEVAAIAEQAESTMGSRTELQDLLKKKEGEQAQAARVLAAKEEERAALESRCVFVRSTEREREEESGRDKERREGENVPL